jgi:hypothetical protein
MTNVIFRILNVLFPKGGWRMSVGSKHAIRKRIFRFLLDYGDASEDRTFPAWFDSRISLAVLEMRLIIVLFVWHFDAELVSSEEPLYEDRFVARRGALDIRVKSVQRPNYKSY